MDQRAFLFSSTNDNNSNNNSSEKDESINFQTCENRFGRSCNHQRHTHVKGAHVAEELPEGEGYTFVSGDCRLIGKDGKVVLINRLHAAAMSDFLLSAFYNANFSEYGIKEVKFPLFTAKEIVDILEMSNYVIKFWLDNEQKYPSFRNLTFQCAFKLLPIASFFLLEHVTKALSKFIERKALPENLVEAYHLAQGMDAELTEKLWRKILTKFPSLFENGSFIYFTPKEIEECLMDRKLNIGLQYNAEILTTYRNAVVPGYTESEMASRKSEIDEIFGEENEIGSIGFETKQRIPHEVIISICK
jgi:hypothetical protein